MGSSEVVGPARRHIARLQSVPVNPAGARRYGTGHKMALVSGPVSKSTGRRFVLLRSEKGTGMRTRSPASNIIPGLVLLVVPHAGEHPRLGVHQIAPLRAGVLPGPREQHEVQGFLSQGRRPVPRAPGHRGAGAQQLPGGQGRP